MLSSLFRLIIPFASCLILLSCGPQKKIGREARHSLLQLPGLQNAHLGITVYDPVSKKHLYNYNGEKYFVPASNVKIPTCYAAMKWLGDSLVGARIGYPHQNGKRTGMILLKPAADPTFLHPDFKEQPLFAYLKSELDDPKSQLSFTNDQWQTERWGSGWTWNDYAASYMAERSAMPVFGNLVTVKLLAPGNRIIDSVSVPSVVTGKRIFSTGHPFLDSIIHKNLHLLSRQEIKSPAPNISITRGIADNNFTFSRNRSSYQTTSFPLYTDNGYLTYQYLQDTFNKEAIMAYPVAGSGRYRFDTENGDVLELEVPEWRTIHSQSTDSMLRPMMHRSDNFFAEQSLLMVSHERLGIMNEQRIIDTILKKEFADLPQRPRWVDGSGLSRYNLFTPQDMVAIIGKMHSEFGADRLKQIFATGNTGTLSNYYQRDSGYFFAKTGTLSGVVAISGFMYTRKGKLLYFSVLVNNHTGPASIVRRSVEKFLQKLRMPD